MQTALEISADSEEKLPQIARQILDFAGTERIFLITGQMGTGKTTLAKAISKALGSMDHFSSPTYSIINEYEFDGGKIYHMDLYRLQTVDELLDLGFEDYLYSSAYCLIEWPQLATALLPEHFIEINISVVHNIRYFRCSYKS